MIRSRFRRSLTLAAVSVIAIGVLGVAPVAARNPNWSITIERLPDTVAAGNDAGYFVTIKNGGPSTINALMVAVTPADTPSATPTYFSGLTFLNGAGPGSCTSSGTLVCQLGTFPDQGTVTFTVAYAVPTSSSGTFNVKVAIEAATGNTGSDGGSSRGDRFDVTAKTDLSASKDFDGGFVVGGDIYQTDSRLGPKNIQSTGLARAPELSPVMIQDGITSLAQCDTAADNSHCASLFGEWSRLNVNNGASGTPFKVTLMIRGSAVPGNPHPESIVFVHVLDDGSIDIIGDDLKNGVPTEETCQFSGTDPVPTNVECRTATKVGSNWRLEVWLFRNGFGRGGF